MSFSGAPAGARRGSGLYRHRMSMAPWYPICEASLVPLPSGDPWERLEPWLGSFTSSRDCLPDRPQGDKARSPTISSKGQITLPKSLREKHHLTEGDEALVVDTDAVIPIRPRPRRRLYGLLKGGIDSDGFQRAIRDLRREWRS
jgi:AbrB family looped-hinge helix DNA binding protein